VPTPREFRFNAAIPLPDSLFDSARVLTSVEAIITQTKASLASAGIVDATFSEGVHSPRIVTGSLKKKKDNAGTDDVSKA
jgi:hypothetical protein